MSEFLERNKKKGSLAALLLFLKRGRGVGPFLAMAMILGAMFIVPAGYHDNLPWLAQFAEKIGLGSWFAGSDNSGGGQSFEDSLSAARRGRDEADALASMRLAAPSLPPGYGKSTVGLVRDPDPLTKADEVKEDISKSDGKAVDGVPLPEDAKKLPDGISLKEDELHKGLMGGGLAALAKAGGFPSGAPGLSGGSPATLSGGMGQGRAADNSNKLLNAALDNSKAPDVGSGGKQGNLDFRAGGRPKLSPSAGGASLGNTAGRTSAMGQLAQGRAFSVAAAPGYCPPGSCPNEYASNASGTVFDGKRQPNGSILGSTAFGDPGVPTTPDAGALNAGASDIERQAKQCQDAIARHSGRIQALSGQIQDISNEMNDMDCNSGGCGGNASKCKSLGDKMKPLCRQQQQELQQQASECPLSGGVAGTSSC